MSSGVLGKQKFVSVFRIRILMKIPVCLLDPDPHGQMRIQIQEVKSRRKRTGSLGEYRTENTKCANTVQSRTPRSVSQEQFCLCRPLLV